MTSDDSIERLRVALRRIDSAAAENVERGLEIQRRIAWLGQQMDAGRTIGDVVADEETPRAVELMTANMAALEGVGAEFRAALALALRADGLTTEAIADLFGVSRQRISALLRQRAATNTRS